jgi:hypothetical protein
MAKPQHVADLAAYFSDRVLSRENAISYHEAGTMRLVERAILRGKAVVLNLKIEGLALLSVTPNPSKTEAAAIIEQATGTKDYAEFTVYSLMEYRTLTAFIQSWHIRQKRAGNLFPRSNTFIRHRGIVRSVSDTLLDQNPKRLKRFLTEHEAGLPQRPHIILFRFQEEQSAEAHPHARSWVSPVTTIPSFSGPSDNIRFKIRIHDRVMNDLFERAEENGDYTAVVSIIPRVAMENALKARQSVEEMADIIVPLSRQGQLHPLLHNPYATYVYPEGTHPVIGKRKKHLWTLS